MFKSLKSLIDSRLGGGIVVDDLSNDYGYFIKIATRHLYTVLFFLKNDPDLRLGLLDQIISLPPGFIQWNQEIKSEEYIEVLYQLKSLKLPYRVTVVVEINKEKDSLPSITPLFLGARFLENDISDAFSITIEERNR